MRKTWVVVADNSRARVFTAETPSSPFWKIRLSVISNSVELYNQIPSYKLLEIVLL